MVSTSRPVPGARAHRAHARRECNRHGGRGTPGSRLRHLPVGIRQAQRAARPQPGTRSPRRDSECRAGLLCPHVHHAEHRQRAVRLCVAEQLPSRRNRRRRPHCAPRCIGIRGRDARRAVCAPRGIVWAGRQALAHEPEGRPASGALGHCRCDDPCGLARDRRDDDRCFGRRHQRDPDAFPARWWSHDDRRHGAARHRLRPGCRCGGRVPESLLCRIGALLPDVRAQRAE